MTTLETEGGGVEENLSSVSKGERAVAEVLSLLLVVEDLDGLTLLEGGLLEEILGNGDGRVGADLVGKGEGDVGDEGRLPLGGLEVASVDEVGDERGNVVDERGLLVELGGLVDLLDAADNDGGRKGGGLVLEGGKVGSVSLGKVSDVTEGLDRLDDDTAGLGVSNGLLDLDEAGEELGKEGADGVLVVDELGHVVLQGEGGKVSSAVCIELRLRLLTMMVATLRTVEVSFSVSPRDRRGAMRARVGESTSETKVVAARSWMVLGTSSTGLMRALLRGARKGRVSLRRNAE